MENSNRLIKTTTSELHFLDQSSRTDHLWTTVDLNKIKGTVEASIINSQNVDSNYINNLKNKLEFGTPSYSLSELDELILDQPMKLNLGLTKEKNTVDYLNYSGLIQRWLCYIEEINPTTFEARMEDLNNPGTYEIGEFDFSEVAKDDQELMAIGAIFYCHAGYVIRNGQVIKESLIRFKRAISWSDSEFDSSVDNADDLLSNLNWD